MKTWVLAAMTAMLATTVMDAQAKKDRNGGRQKKSAAEVFEELDANEDGRLSKAEYTDYWTEQQDSKGDEFDEGKFDSKFDEMDGNGDLFLSQEEFSKARKSRGK